VAQFNAQSNSPLTVGGVSYQPSEVNAERIIGLLLYSSLLPLSFLSSLFFCSFSLSSFTPLFSSFSLLFSCAAL